METRREQRPPARLFVSLTTGFPAQWRPWNNRCLGPLPAGTRLLGVIILPVVLTESPATTLLTQGVIVALIGNTSGYCRTPLLDSELSHGRLHRMALVLEYASLPVASVLPAAALISMTWALLLDGEGQPLVRAAMEQQQWRRRAALV